MKLLKLRLSNLNSLFGEWSIDFEHREYQSNGLFAITGPTGAGKSTLLDAIALALYGRTPRLANISITANEIMSRDCGECFAEVTFQSSKGIFRAHWSQRRARGKGDGKLQAPQHELIEVNSMRVLTTKKIETLSVIQSIVGLDYDQFMRSIMLAQGDFANFLKSEDSKRAAILAKITGTDIYARIGIAVYQRHRAELESLQSLAVQASAIELLSAESIADMAVQIQAIEDKLAELGLARRTAELAARWLDHFDALNREIAVLAIECQTRAQTVKAAQPRRQALERAQSAAALRRSLENFKVLQTKQRSGQKILETLKSEFAEAAAAQARLHHELQQVKDAAAKLSDGIESARPLWREIHDLDLQIGHRQSLVEKTLAQVDSIVAKRGRLQTEDAALASELERTEAKLSRLQDFQSTHRLDADLASQLPIIELRCNEYLSALVLQQQIQAELKSFATQEQEASGNELVAREHFELAKHAVAELEKSIHEIAAHRQATMDGLAAETLQAEIEAAIHSKAAMLDQVAIIEAILKEEKELAARSEERSELQRAFSEHQKVRSELEKLVAQQVQLVAAYEASVLKDTLIASLQDHRSRLVAGQPCDLCGSIDHPWANDVRVPQIGEAVLALQEAKAMLAQYNARREAVDRDIDRTEQALLQADAGMAASAVALEKLRGQWTIHASRNKLGSVVDEAALDSARRLFCELSDREQSLVTRQRKATAFLERIVNLQGELSKLVTARSTFEQRLQAITNLRLGIQESKARANEAFDQHQAAVATKRNELTSSFDRLQLAWPDDLTSAMKSLASRSTLWQTSVVDRVQTEKERLHLHAGRESLARQMEQLDHELQESSGVLAIQNAELAVLMQRRQQLFDDQDPGKLETELQAEHQRLKDDLEQKSREYEPIVAGCQNLDRRVVQQESSLAADMHQMQTQQQTLEIDLQAAGFADLYDLESAIQTDRDIETSILQLAELDQDFRDATARLQQKEKERAEWQLEKFSDLSIEALKQELEGIDTSIDRLRGEKIGLQHRLSENQLRAGLWHDAQIQLTTRQQQVQRWSVLKELIGSADGDKFRKFAQGITFELLIAYANSQLRKLTDRYLLRKAEEGLNMVVVDHYQSSRSRSAANLSGGETFLVSLALALGLSKLASQNVQIDSLFLDEGFGTLDEESLEEALYTLSSLRQEGKLVGLISHVPALNQQIPVRIEVVKGPLGRSRIQGPGVKNLSRATTA